MRIPQPIIPVSSPLQPVTVFRSGSADVIKVPYILCLNGWVPEAFELWALADDRVREVHLYARVRLLSEFREDTFHTHLFISRRFQIPFLGRRALNNSVEFLDVVCTTQHIGSRVNYTPNIFVHSWGVNHISRIDNPGVNEYIWSIIDTTSNVLSCTENVEKLDTLVHSSPTQERNLESLRIEE